LIDFNDPLIADGLLRAIRRKSRRTESLRIMEVCGTHTMAIGRHGIRRLIPENIQLLSGPGCPVCVTPAGYIDNAAALALKRGVMLATFGDMVRVPGYRTSLERARADGARLKVVSGPAEILDWEEEAVFLAVGFETTAAPIAAIMDTVITKGLANLSFYVSLKTIPNILKILQADPETAIDGFLLPGHVSAIIGSNAYSFLAVPSVIAGFDAADILGAIEAILDMRISGRRGIVNAYSRVVKVEGNPKAVALINKYLEPCSEAWRGLGRPPGCSLKLRAEYASIDAERRYDLPGLDERSSPGCQCGEVLKGKITPMECRLFGTACTPENPAGPCMVSSEGSCAAFFRYRA
jgi:hydrogenase expression/formation protein HypD